MERGAVAEVEINDEQFDPAFQSEHLTRRLRAVDPDQDRWRMNNVERGAQIRKVRWIRLDQKCLHIGQQLAPTAWRAS